MAGREIFVILSSLQSCPATRFAFFSCLTIQQFIRSPAHSSHGGTRECAQLMHRVWRVINALWKTLQQEQPTCRYTVRSIYSVHALQYLPAWAGASLFFFFCLIPTYYEIDRDGEGTHHAGVFHSGPISLQLPVLAHVVQSVSQ